MPNASDEVRDARGRGGVSERLLLEKVVYVQEEPVAPFRIGLVWCWSRKEALGGQEALCGQEAPAETVLSPGVSLERRASEAKNPVYLTVVNYA